VNVAAAAKFERSAVSVSIESLILQRAAGESIQITAPRVRVTTSGGHQSTFKGRGIEFDESRLYQPGDDLRTMDWRVTARTGEPHTKVFREERNRPIIAWIDLRREMMFATRGVYKAVIAAESAAIVAWSAIAHGDRLGALVFSDSDHHELRPRLGRASALRLFQLICDSWHPASAETEHASAAASLQRLTRVARPGSLVFLASDFRDLDADSERHLKRLAVHSDLLLMHVFDAVEARLPPPGRYRIFDGARARPIDTGSAAARDRYARQFDERRERLMRLQKLPGVAVVECRTDEDPQTQLGRRFRKK
jgi:uncharacterized protein (DUF58 family)